MFEMSTTLEVLQVALLIVVGGIAIYFKSSLKAQKVAKEVQEAIAEITGEAVMLIAQAEEYYKDTTKAGGQKFAYVVDKLYDLVPDPIKPIITKEMIGNIVQSTFDQVETYVRTQLDAVADEELNRNVIKQDNGEEA